MPWAVEDSHGNEKNIANIYIYMYVCATFLNEKTVLPVPWHCMTKR